MGPDLTPHRVRLFWWLCALALVAAWMGRYAGALIVLGSAAICYPWNRDPAPRG